MPACLILAGAFIRLGCGALPAVHLRKDATFNVIIYERLCYGITKQGPFLWMRLSLQGMPAESVFS